MNEEISVDDIKDAVSEALSGTLEDVLEEKLEDALEEKLEDVLEETLENVLEDMLEDAISDVLGNYLPDAMKECMSELEFVLKDGTVVRPRQYMRLLSPDKSKQLLCYGGLWVDEGNRLVVQTRVSCWEDIAAYASREEAIAKLQLVKKAMDDGMAAFEL